MIPWEVSVLAEAIARSEGSDGVYERHYDKARLLLTELHAMGAVIVTDAEDDEEEFLDDDD